MAATNHFATANNNNDEILAALNIIEDIIPRLNSLSDPDCVEGMALRCDAVKRYLVNIGIDDTILELIDRVCRRLNQCSQRSTASNNLASPTLVYTGCRGKPSYNVDEEQLNFLLEQGFTVSEVSQMIGVSERTLQRRMRSLGISVAGNDIYSNYFSNKNVWSYTKKIIWHLAE